MNLKLVAVIERINRGEHVEYSEPGNSMVPIIKHREPVTLAPVNTDLLEKGDVVLAKVHGRFFTHKVNAVRVHDVQIANNHGHVNGWTPKKNVFAIVIAVSGRPRPSAIAKIKKSV